MLRFAIDMHVPVALGILALLLVPGFLLSGRDGVEESGPRHHNEDNEVSSPEAGAGTVVDVTAAMVAARHFSMLSRAARERPFGIRSFPPRIANARAQRPGGEHREPPVRCSVKFDGAVLIRVRNGERRP